MSKEQARDKRPASSPLQEETGKLTCLLSDESVVDMDGDDTIINPDFLSSTVLEDRPGKAQGDKSFSQTEELKAAFGPPCGQKVVRGRRQLLGKCTSYRHKSLLMAAKKRLPTLDTKKLFPAADWPSLSRSVQPSTSRPGGSATTTAVPRVYLSRSVQPSTSRPGGSATTTAVPRIYLNEDLTKECSSGLPVPLCPVVDIPTGRLRYHYCSASGLPERRPHQRTFRDRLDGPKLQETTEN
ncbi:hypothetical protein ACOMHN_033825 [Nucella lapillus]